MCSEGFLVARNAIQHISGHQKSFRTHFWSPEGLGDRYGTQTIATKLVRFMSKFPLAGINLCGEFLATRDLAWLISGHQEFSFMCFWWPEILPYTMGSESLPAQSIHHDVFRNHGLRNPLALIPWGWGCGAASGRHI